MERNQPPQGDYWSEYLAANRIQLQPGISAKLCKALKISGPFNIQFICKEPARSDRMPHHGISTEELKWIHVMDLVPATLKVPAMHVVAHGRVPHPNDIGVRYIALRHCLFLNYCYSSYMFQSGNMGINSTYCSLYYPIPNSCARTTR